MTGITLFGSLDVGCMLTGSACAVMTSGTETRRLHTGVIEAGVGPVIGGVVAGITLLCGLNVSGVLTGSPNAIVTS